MRLSLHNRSRQHATLHVTPPLRDGRPMMGARIFVDAGASGPRPSARPTASTLGAAAMSRRGPASLSR